MKNNNSQKKDSGKRELLFLAVFFCFSIANIVFGILFLSGVEKKIIADHLLLWAVLLGFIVSALFVCTAWFVLTRKETLTKTLLSLDILLLFSMILLFVLQKTGFFSVIHDAELFRRYLERAGVWMPLLYIFFQYLQVVVLPIPSLVSTLAGVALFGAFKTVIFSFIGILLGSYTAFFIGRKLGNKAVSWMVGEDSLKKWQRKLKGKDNLFLTTMFLLPLFPDDILCFLAGLSSMSIGYFTGMILVSRFLAITTTCYSINFIPFNTWWGITIWIVLAIVVIFLFIYIYKNMNKIQDKITAFKNRKKDKNK